MRADGTFHISVCEALVTTYVCKWAEIPCTASWFMETIMLKHFLPASILAVAMISTPPADAGFVSGADLLDACSPARIDPVYRLKVAQCRGYVVGVADTFDCRNPTIGFTWNGEAKTTEEALVVVVTKWLRNNPSDLHYQANGLVAAALSTEFPCSRAETRN